MCVSVSRVSVVAFRFIEIQTVELQSLNFVENACCCVRCGLHAAVLMKRPLLLDTKSNRLVYRYLEFRGACCLHLQGGNKVLHSVGTYIPATHHHIPEAYNQCLLFC